MPKSGIVQTQEKFLDRCVLCISESSADAEVIHGLLQTLFILLRQETPPETNLML